LFIVCSHALLSSSRRSRQLDNFGTVCEVSFAGLQAVESRALSTLPGKHESFLNNCLYVHKKNLVDDWIEFFRGNWAAMLFCDDFPSFVKALKQSVVADKGRRALIFVPLLMLFLLVSTIFGLLASHVW
jgi:hypothetical protein